MKTAILTLAFVAAIPTAQANPFAEAENMAGGKMTILTDACKDKPGQSRAYYYARDGLTEDGCWRYDGEPDRSTWHRNHSERWRYCYHQGRCRVQSGENVRDCFGLCKVLS